MLLLTEHFSVAQSICDYPSCDHPAACWDCQGEDFPGPKVANFSLCCMHAHGRPAFVQQLSCFMLHGALQVHETAAGPQALLTGVVGSRKGPQFAA